MSPYLFGSVYIGDNQSNQGLPSRFIQNINITKAPFTVIVLCTNSKYFCSGVIVDVNWTLTTAHCFYDLQGHLTEDANSILVVAGTNGLNDASADIKSGNIKVLQRVLLKGQAQIRKSKTLKIHELYNWKQKFVNDIALIKVEEPFVKSERVAVAVLNLTDPDDQQMLTDAKEKADHDATDPVDIVDLPCAGYGYGRVSMVSDHAADGTVKGQEYIINKHCHCLEWIRSYKSPVDIMRQRNIFICDHYKMADSGLCAGDNGGPLICGGMLRAIATTVFYYSDRDNCKMAPKPTDCGDHQTLKVFTDVCYFGEWLHENVGTYPNLDELCSG